MATKRSSRATPGRGVSTTASATGQRRSSRVAALLGSNPLSPSARSQSRRIDVPPLPLPDRRIYNPEPKLTRPARRISGRPARVVAPTPGKRILGRSGKSQGLSPSVLLFARSAGVSLCVQRGVRKEVIHAKGIAGRKGLKKPKRNAYSHVRCK